MKVSQGYHLIELYALDGGSVGVAGALSAMVKF